MKKLMTFAAFAAATLMTLTSCGQSETKAEEGTFNKETYAKEHTARINEIVTLTEEQSKQVEAIFLEEAKEAEANIQAMKADCPKQGECPKAECNKCADCPNKGECPKADCPKREECLKNGECPKANGECPKMDCNKKANCPKADRPRCANGKANCPAKADCPKREGCIKAGECPKANGECNKAECNKCADCPNKGECSKADCPKREECLKNGECPKANGECPKMDCNKKGGRRHHKHCVVSPETKKATMEKVKAVLTPEQLELLQAHRSQKRECINPQQPCCPQQKGK